MASSSILAFVGAFVFAKEENMSDLSRFKVGGFVSVSVEFWVVSFGVVVELF